MKNGPFGTHARTDDEATRKQTETIYILATEELRRALDKFEMRKEVKTWKKCLKLQDCFSIAALGGALKDCSII